MRDIVQVCEDSAWGARAIEHPRMTSKASSNTAASCVFPHLRFELTDDERRLLDAGVADGSAKNISLRGPNDEVRGAAPAHADALQADDPALPRAGDGAGRAAVPALPRPLEARQPVVSAGRQSRAARPAGARTTRACTSTPSRPIRCTANACCACSTTSTRTDSRAAGASANRSRTSRAASCRRSRGRCPARPRCCTRCTSPSRGAAPTTTTCCSCTTGSRPTRRIRATHRSRPIDFAPGTTWVVYSDQVLHAAMGGQFMMEQTFYLEPRRPADPGQRAAGGAAAAARPAVAVAQAPHTVALAVHRFRPRLLDALKGYARERFLTDVGAGLTVGVVALPLAMAFAHRLGRQARAGPVHRHRRRLPDQRARRLAACRSAGRPARSSSSSTASSSATGWPTC